jgi:hypothetical protein
MCVCLFKCLSFCQSTSLWWPVDQLCKLSYLADITIIILVKTMMMIISCTAVWYYAHSSMHLLSTGERTYTCLFILGYQETPTERWHHKWQWVCAQSYQGLGTKNDTTLMRGVINSLNQVFFPLCSGTQNSKKSYYCYWELFAGFWMVGFI